MAKCRKWLMLLLLLLLSRSRSMVVVVVVVAAARHVIVIPGTKHARVKIRGIPSIQIHSCFRCLMLCSVGLPQYSLQFVRRCGAWLVGCLVGWLVGCVWVPFLRD